MARHHTRRSAWRMPAVAGVALSLVLAACGGGETTAEPDTGTEEPAEEAEAAPEETYQVAYLSASSANTWLAASLAEMEAVAAANGVEITEYDAQFTPGVQSQQIQDIIVSGQYDAIVIASVDGAGIIPDLEEAMDAGLKVAILNQVVGDALDTPDPQFDGPVVSVMAPPLRSGERFGELTIQACEGISPCNVVYFYGIRGIPIDNALREGFDATIAANPDITVVADAEGQYLGPDVALAAMQDVLQRTTDIDVVIGPDQAIQGVELALQDAGIEGVKLIGLGGSQPAFDGIAEGRWFGTVMGAPGTEGRLTMEALVAALRDGTITGGIDPLTELPHNGLVTADTIDDFEPEWAG